MRRAPCCGVQGIGAGGGEGGIEQLTDSGVVYRKGECGRGN